MFHAFLRPSSPAPLRKQARAALGLFAALMLALPAPAQEFLSTSPRGVVDLPPLNRPAASAPAAAVAPAALSVAGTPGPLLPDPARLARPVVFGSQIFSGRSGSETFSGFNPEYQVAVGDRIAIRMWEAFNHESVQPVDAHGNLFIPNVGPVRVLGVRSADHNAQVEAQVKRTFRANVGVYATLEAAQPVTIYVTGFVKAPGLYGGLSSDSVLYYLDRADGIDPDRRSYLEVDVLRGGKPRARINLYRFLLEGRIDPLQLQDGDAIVVNSRMHTVQVGGEVLSPYIFEFGRRQFTATELLAVARPRPSATHMSIVRRTGEQRRSEDHPLAGAGQVAIVDGAEVAVTSDKYPGTILGRIEGANLGERTLVLPYVAKLQAAIERMRPAPQASVGAVHLFRRSVAVRQKELLESSLRSLETIALTARSATSEAAALRGREAQHILEFVERARKVEPRGQVVLARPAGAGKTLLEDGDVIRMPEISNLVLMSGEMLFPNALIYDQQSSLESYVQQAGGYTQGAVAAMQPGDEIMVLPEIETKSVEIAHGISQILDQIAVSAAVVLGL